MYKTVAVSESSGGSPLDLTYRHILFGYLQVVSGFQDIARSAREFFGSTDCKMLFSTPEHQNQAKLIQNSKYIFPPFFPHLFMESRSYLGNHTKLVWSD